MLVVVAAVTAAPARAQVDQSPGSGPTAIASGARIVVVGAEPSPALLQRRIADLLGGPAANVEIQAADAFVPQALFELGTAEDPRLSAWVVITEAAVQVRVAGAGRDRFVFRDLAAAPPLSELDLERAGQTLKVALFAVAEGGPAVLTRARAETALGLSPPRVAQATDTVAASAAPAPPRAVSPHDESDSEPNAWGLAAFFQGTYAGSHIPRGPGLLTSYTFQALEVRPAVWASVYYGLPQDLGDAALLISLSVWRIGLRGGAALEVGPNTQVGVGFGVDKIETLAATIQDRSFVNLGADRLHFWVPFWRMFARVGPIDIGGVRASASLFVELTPWPPPDRIGGGGGRQLVLYHEPWISPGAALEVWFR